MFFPLKDETSSSKIWHAVESELQLLSFSGLQERYRVSNRADGTMSLSWWKWHGVSKVWEWWRSGKFDKHVQATLTLQFWWDSVANSLLIFKPLYLIKTSKRIIWVIVKSPTLRASGLESVACRPLHSQHQLQTEKSQMHTLDDRNVNVHSFVFVYISSIQDTYTTKVTKVEDIHATARKNQTWKWIKAACNYAVITMWISESKGPKDFRFFGAFQKCHEPVSQYPTCSKVRTRRRFVLLAFLPKD